MGNIISELTSYDYDSGWVTLTPNTGLEHYNSEETLRIRKVGFVVQIIGRVKFNGKANFYANTVTGQLIATIPTEFRPLKDVRQLNQAWEANRVMIAAKSDGQLLFARYWSSTYKNSSDKVLINANSWFRCDLMYTI